MDEGEIKMKTKIGNLHEELIIKDEPINQFSVLPSTENSNIPQKRCKLKQNGHVVFHSVQIS